MRVLEIWRFPVKSLQGERLDRAAVGPDGLAGDRQWALFDVDTGFGLTARRHPELLFAAAAMAADGSVSITLPDGTVADDAALSQWLDRPVQLRSAAAQTVRRYENPDDFEDESQPWAAFDGSLAAFHDDDQATLSLVSTETLRDWDRRRFRPNLVLTGSGEDELVGHRVAIGSAQLSVTAPLERCVMTTRPQPAGIERDLDVLRTVHRERYGRLGVGAIVTRHGEIAVGDVVSDASAAVRTGVQ